MPQRITTTEHSFVAAACIPVDLKTAKRGVDRHSIRVEMLPADLRIDVLETYCSECRRPFDEVADRPCEAAESNEHLRGGPAGRKSRAHYYHDCDAFNCPPEVRRDAV